METMRSGDAVAGALMKAILSLWSDEILERTGGRAQSPSMKHANAAILCATGSASVTVLRLESLGCDNRARRQSMGDFTTTSWGIHLFVTAPPVKFHFQRSNPTQFVRDDTDEA